MECYPFNPAIACGLPIPPHEHAISVSLPTWQSNLDYEEDKKRVTGVLVRGYPRFIVHQNIRKLGALCVKRFGDGSTESCLIFPTESIAEECRLFVERRSALDGAPVQARWSHLRLLSNNMNSHIDLHIVVFPLNAFPLAKQFWQHTGLGITTRLTTLALEMLAVEIPSSQPLIDMNGSKPGVPNDNVAKDEIQTGGMPLRLVRCQYNLNIDSEAGDVAKRLLRQRIAGSLASDSSADAERGLTSSDISEEDVVLFPTGMAAIWTIHQLAMSTIAYTESICFGFLYTDTLKVLQKWGPGCYHLGRGIEPDIKELEALLETLSTRIAANSPPVPALFTEFPSNPLLQSFDLSALRRLADKYGFLLVVDDTVATAVNADVLLYADVIVTSLSKFFSGYADVMGGSLVLNPRSRHYEKLKSALRERYVDTYFTPDAICMELNSRDFIQRMRTINSNAEHICDFLRSYSLAAGGQGKSPIIRDVYYPKYITRQHYNRCRREAGGYGGLFSLTFTRKSASRAFYDALSCCKGPSLGTTFTLSCPYTILAHFIEMDWAAEWGVEESLVRVSIGTEPLETLMEWFKTALDAVENNENYMKY